MMKTHRCRVAGPLPYLWLGMVAIFTLIGVPLLVAGLIRGGQDDVPPLFAILWIAMVGWLWYIALVWIAYEVRLSATGELEFRSVLRSIRMDAADLISIRPAQRGWDPYTLLFKSRTRTARAMRQMDGLHDLIADLRAINPKLELRGV